MLVYGRTGPYLECSSKGDTRFSAFYARPASLKGKSIEEAYQAAKVCEDGSTGLNWRQAKGRKPVNAEQVKALYDSWWKEWVTEKNLLPFLKRFNGFTDVFGKSGHVCQAEVLWRIRNGEL